MQRLCIAICQGRDASLKLGLTTSANFKVPIFGFLGYFSKKKFLALAYTAVTARTHVGNLRLFAQTNCSKSNDINAHRAELQPPDTFQERYVFEAQRIGFA